MTTQTVEDMVAAGATNDKARAAKDLFDMLRPGLMVKRNGRIDTIYGDKTVLGLYRSIIRCIGR
jgi:hypothetical protein